MSVVIKGLEMPKCCDECPCYRAINDYWDYECGVTLEERDDGGSPPPTTCPLVELPKGHGRLIDADALYVKVDDIGANYSSVIGVYAEEVDNAPTVIEADEKSEFDSNNSELKPCPFCGHEAELRQDRKSMWYVTCTNTVSHGGCQIVPAPKTKTFVRKENAIEAWNRRVKK